MLQTGRSPVRIPDEVDFFNLPNPSSRTMSVGSTQSCGKSYCAVFSPLLLVSFSEVQIFYSSFCPQIYTRINNLWEEVIDFFPFTPFEYLTRQAEKKNYYVCVMK
jgi:hypothetical protein